MTVITKPRKTCFVFTNSNTTSSSNESLHLIDTQLPTREEISAPAVTEPIACKRFTGKRKARRFLNQWFLLENLTDEEEDPPQLVKPYKHYFSSLRQDEFWHNFKEPQRSSVVTKSRRKLNPFENISAKIRRTVRKRGKAAAEILAKLEEEVLEFFDKTTDSIYVRKPRNSFERFLLHAVAQFHGLASANAFTEGFYLVEVEKVKGNEMKSARLRNMIHVK